MDRKDRPEIVEARLFVTDTKDGVRVDLDLWDLALREIPELADRAQTSRRRPKRRRWAAVRPRSP